MVDRITSRFSPNPNGLLKVERAETFLITVASRVPIQSLELHCHFQKLLSRRYFQGYHLNINGVTLAKVKIATLSKQAEQLGLGLAKSSSRSATESSVHLNRAKRESMVEGSERKNSEIDYDLREKRNPRKRTRAHAHAG